MTCEQFDDEETYLYDVFFHITMGNRNQKFCIRTEYLGRSYVLNAIKHSALWGMDTYRER